MGTVYQFDVTSSSYMLNTGSWSADSGTYYYAIIPLEVGKVYKVTLQNVTTLSRFRVAQADSTEIGAATLSFVGYNDTPQDGFGLSFVAEKDYLICYGGTANGGEVTVYSVMERTDLTGTTWKFGSELPNTNGTTYASRFSYNVDWTYVITYDEIERGSNTVFCAAVTPNGFYFPSLSQTEFKVATDQNLYYAYYTVNEGIPFVASNGQYPNFQSFTVTFTGGADATNANLIYWLLDNATLVEEEPTATTITYNGETIATLEAGQTATIKTAETEVEHDIVVKAGSGSGVVKPILQEKTATENGEYLPEKGYDGFSKFTVDVKSGGSGEGISTNVSTKSGNCPVIPTQIAIERPTINIEGTGEVTE